MMNVDKMTLPAAYPSHGGGKNEPTMDNAGCALLSLATGATFRTMSVKEVRRRHMKLAGGGKMKRKAGTGAWVYKMKPPICRVE
jgi:hypothetical protein